MTPVIFRKFKDDGQIIALFLKEPWDRSGKITSYMHMGQHGGACPSIVTITSLATKEEYAPLLRELKSIGYSDLKIYKRMNRS